MNEFENDNAREEGQPKAPDTQNDGFDAQPAAESEQLETVETTGQDAPEPKKGSWKKEVLDWTLSIAVALVVALLIRNFVFTLVNVDGSSMIPTLQDGDTLYVNRFLYEPKQGDIIILHPPQSYNTPYVKRVIALEGQVVDIKPEEGAVYVDGERLDEPYASEPITSGGTLTYPYTVKDGCVFVLGDNRSPNGSSDSRVLGPIPVENIMGKALFRILPFRSFGSLYQ